MRTAIWISILAVGGMAAGQIGGCYYMQAVGGQLELMRKRAPITEVLEDPSLEAETRRKLELVLEARRFAVDRLDLPDNDSYRSYADLERDFVVWNVFAAPEFSLEPRTWCYPVVGCLAYRGYFDEAAARRQAARLEAQGYDVHVGGVPAYSTLGRFDDPLLNTMMRWSDVSLVSTLFHELAHQKLFVKGDTGFNESFATAVAEIGLERWLDDRGMDLGLPEYRRRNQLRREYNRLADETRRALAELYAQSLDDEVKRHRKRELLDHLSTKAAAIADSLGFASSGWLEAPLNNARLASVSLYRGNVPAFRQLLDDCEQGLGCFYAEAGRLAALNLERREAALDVLAARGAELATASQDEPGAGY